MMLMTISQELSQGESLASFWRAQVVGWLFLAIIGFASRAAVFENTEAAFWLTLGVEPLAFVLTSIAAMLLIRRPLKARTPILVLPCAVLLCAATAILLAFIAYAIHLLLVPGTLPSVPDHQFRLGFIYYMGMLSIWTLIFFGVSAELAARTERFFKIKAETRALRLELEHLQLQVAPHFLFNSLNTIVAEIAYRPAIAEEMTRRLAGYLRYSLDRRSQGLCSMQEEIKAAQAYIAILTLRFDKRLECRCQIDPATLNVALPHMTLQGLVENAIKHGMRNEHEYFVINICTRLIAGQTIIEVDNPGRFKAPFDLAKGSGGLDNLCRRLALKYGSRYEFSLDQRNDSIVATIRLRGDPVTI